MDPGQGGTGDPAAAQRQSGVTARLDPAAGDLAAVQFQLAGGHQHGGQPGVLPGQRDAADVDAGCGDLQDRPARVRRQHPYGMVRSLLRQQGHRAVKDQHLHVIPRGDTDLVTVGGGAQGGGDAAVGAAAPLGLLPLLVGREVVLGLLAAQGGHLLGGGGGGAGDEFATLYREIPDFIPGLVSIAQRGRSLGIHLILATQRPAGVVSADIRANTNLRIALRVTDTAESQDVIDTKDAVSISPNTPGRALARLGHGTVVPFQTAYAGATRPGAEPAPQPQRATDPPQIWGTELPWQRLGRPVGVPGPVGEPAVDVLDDDLPTDLNALVAAVREATELVGCVPQPSPWLPALDQNVLIDDLPQAEPTEGGGLAPVPWALSDLPDAQAQLPVQLDLDTFGHLYVIGIPRSGRSQVLRTLAGSLARGHSAADVHLYGIDYAGGALSALGVLPHCGAVVPRGDTERLERLFARLDAELERHQDQLTQHHAANLAELREIVPTGSRPAHVLLLIDGWDTLVDLVAEHNGGRQMDQLNRLLREGAASGLHVVATSERALLAGRAASLNDNKLLLRLNERTEYHAVGRRWQELPDVIRPGQGWTSDGTEIQVALLGPGASGQEQAEALRAIGAEATRRDAGLPAARRPFRIGSLPTKVAFTDAYEKVGEEFRRPMWALLGLGGDEVAPVGVDFAETSPTFAVSGPPGSGRSTTLASLAVSLLASGTRLVVLTPGTRRCGPSRGIRECGCWRPGRPRKRSSPPRWGRTAGLAWSSSTMPTC